ncbi:glycosyltransferase [Vibrio sp. 10N.222.54.F10]|uniref:glycosyltransferase n=1 Tax=Vibrio sp. 10N.222.54.F10 TaxID=1884469 RepID=UPI000C867B81|nr:glycosyltransferase [Vibrio sp. 10N.222.54.F10]PMO16608.1 hypothetical protein BCT17_06695 [Vibrio sp. 10N.222.54.F10]
MKSKRKILYLTTVDKKTDPGVFNKIGYQVSSFERLGFEVVLGYFDGKYYIFDNEIIYKKKHGILQPFYDRFFFPKAISEKASSLEFDVYYIRKPFISYPFVNFISKLKKSRVVLEIPTYPYKKELSGFVRKLLYMYERACASLLKGKLDFITFYGDELSTIWGIRALRLENGICVNSVKKVIPSVRNESGINIINLIAVGNLSKWHGYERLIEGVATLKSEHRKRIRVDIVGEGAVYQELKVLAHDLDVEGIVTFHGFKGGKELDDIYSRADLGIGSLGMYKLGLLKGSTLKAREFTARGIPFILGYDDLAFPLDTDFVKYVPNNSTPLDIESIIYWYDNKEFNRNSIRAYACEKLTWDQQMKRIVIELENTGNYKYD